MLRATAQLGAMAISKAVGEETTIRRVAAATGEAAGMDKVTVAVAAGDGVVTNHTAIMK